MSHHVLEVSILFHPSKNDGWKELDYSISFVVTHRFIENVSVLSSHSTLDVTSWQPSHRCSFQKRGSGLVSSSHKFESNVCISASASWCKLCLGGEHQRLRRLQDLLHYKTNSTNLILCRFWETKQDRLWLVNQNPGDNLMGFGWKKVSQQLTQVLHWNRG